MSVLIDEEVRSFEPARPFGVSPASVGQKFVELLAGVKARLPIAQPDPFFHAPAAAQASPEALITLGQPEPPAATLIGLSPGQIKALSAEEFRARFAATPVNTLRPAQLLFIETDKKFREVARGVREQRGATERQARLATLQPAAHPERRAPLQSGDFVDLSWLPQRQAQVQPQVERQRQAQAQQQVERQRQAQAQLQIEEQRQAQAQLQIEEQRQAQAQLQIEEQRQAQAQLQIEEQRQAQAQQQVEEQRQAQAQQQVEEQRQAQAQLQIEEQRQAQAQLQIEEQRQVQEQRQAQAQARVKTLIRLTPEHIKALSSEEFRRRFIGTPLHALTSEQLAVIDAEKRLREIAHDALDRMKNKQDVMRVTLPKGLAEFVEQQVEAGFYRDASELISESLRFFQKQTDIDLLRLSLAATPKRASGISKKSVFPG